MPSSSSAVSGRDLAKALKAAFLHDDSPSFPDLGPTVELLELVDAYSAAHQLTSSATGSLGSAASVLSDTLTEVTARVARSKERGDSIGRASAWLIVLARLCSNEVETLPRSAIGPQLWQGLLRRALVGSASDPDLFLLSRNAILAAKALLIYALDEPLPGEEDSLSDFEQEVLAEFLDSASFVGGESDARGRMSRGKDRGATHLEDVLVALGRQRPKAFLDHLARWLPIKADHRAAILRLVNDFCRMHPAQTYHALTTPLFRHLLDTVLIDGDIHVIQLALTAIVTLLPRIPSTLETFLPALLAALARSITLIDPHFSPSKSAAALDELSSGPPASLRPDVAWRRLSAPLTPADPSADVETLHRDLVQEMFACLYGIIPCNVVAFLRAPTDYLVEKQWLSPFADGPTQCFDPQLLRDRTETLFAGQTLHPALVYSTTAKELDELPRHAKRDAADIMLLCQHYTAGASRGNIGAGPHRVKSPPSATVTEAEVMLPTLGSPLTSEMAFSPSPASTPSTGRPAAASESASTRCANLEREVDLLRAEVAYELSLKSQHGDRLGAMHRDRVREASGDAERQALHDALRNYKAKLAAAEALIKQGRTEAAMSKNQHREWVKRQSNRISRLQEIERKALTREKADEARLGSAQATMAEQSQELEALNTKLFDLEAQARADAPKLEERSHLDARIKRLTGFLLAWDEDMSKARQQRQQMEGIVSEWQKAEQLRELDGKRIEELVDALRSAEEEVQRLRSQPARSVPTSSRQSAASSRTDLILREQYAILRRKSRALEEELVELRATVSLPVPEY